MSAAFIFESPLTKLTKPLNNSNTVAIVASIGIHALVLGLAFPYLATSSKNSSDQTDVRLIELTPAEQSRLPKQSTPTPDITQFSNPSLGDTALLDTPTVAPNQIPPSIDSWTPSPTASLPSLPSLPPLGDYQSAPSGTPRPTIGNMNIYSPPIASVPPIPSQQNLPDPPQLRTPERYQEPETRFNDENLRPDFPPTGDSNVDIRNAPIDQGYQRQQELNQQQEQTALADPRRIDPNLEEERMRSLIAAQNQRIRELQESTQFNAANTSSDEARKNYLDWLNQEEVKRKTVKPPEIAINGKYPTWVSATGRQLQGTSVFGVVVDASGKPVPKLIQSSGYAALDKQAEEDIKAYLSQNPGANQPNLVKVSYAPPANVERNLPQPQNNQRQTTPSRETTPNTPAITPSPQPVQPSSQPTNKQPETQITQPNNPDNQKPPVVEQSPNQENTQQQTQPVPIQETQEKPKTPVVEQSPMPENIKPDTVSEPEAPSTPNPTVAEPPAAPATQKPNPEEPPLPTSQKPTQTVEPPNNGAAPKKPAIPTPEAQNNPSNNTPGT